MVMLMEITMLMMTTTSHESPSTEERREMVLPVELVARLLVILGNKFAMASYEKWRWQGWPGSWKQWWWLSHLLERAKVKELVDLRIFRLPTPIKILPGRPSSWSIGHEDDKDDGDKNNNKPEFRQDFLLKKLFFSSYKDVFKHLYVKKKQPLKGLWVGSKLWSIWTSTAIGCSDTLVHGPTGVGALAEILVNFDGDIALNVIT